MPSTGIINGTDLRLFMNTGSGAVEAIGYATNVTLDLSAETRDTLNKDNVGSWATTDIGQLSGTCTGEALYSMPGALLASRQGFSDLFSVFSNKTKVYCAVRTATSGDKYLKFYAYLTSLSQNGPVEENATFSFTLTITGTVTEDTYT